MSEINEVLNAVNRGDPQAGQKLFQLIYDDLRRLAKHLIGSERPGITLQPTALVHEAYLRLVGDSTSDGWDGRGHFFTSAAQAMRRILVESARSKTRLKRGGDMERLPLDPDLIAGPERAEELLALDEALTDFAAVDPEAARLVTLRYFGGLTVEEAAAAMGFSPRTAKYTWAYARAWLQKRLRREEDRV